MHFLGSVRIRFQGIFIQRIKVGNYQQAAQQFRDKTESAQILKFTYCSRCSTVQLILLICTFKSDSRRFHPAGDHFIDTFKSTAANEQDILRICV